MSPERQAVLNAINMGNRTTSLIAIAVDQPPQTVAKMIYKLKKLGIILVDNSGCLYIPVDNSVDSNVDISTPLSTSKSTPVDNSILTRLNFIEDSLAILAQKNTESKQQFEQLKKELLSELKKSSSDSVSSEQMNQTIVALKTDKIELNNQLEKQAGLIQKLTTDNKQLVLKNTNKFENIETLTADIKRLVEAKEASEARSKEAEQAHSNAVKEVVKLASENVELRNEREQYNNANFKEAMLQERIEFLEKPCGIILGIIQRAKESTPTESEVKDFLKVLEIEIEGLYIASIPIDESVIEGQYHKVQDNEKSQEMPTIEQNSLINEPEMKFTLDEAQERFLELRKEFPSKKQKEYLKILDDEGYTNSVGNSVGAYNLNRWRNADKTTA